MKPHTDQAEGLRRLSSAPLPGLCTVLSTDDEAHKGALMHRLAASMCRRGYAVILVDGVGDPGAGVEVVKHADGANHADHANGADGADSADSGGDTDRPYAYGADADAPMHTLLDVARGQASLHDAGHAAPGGYRCVKLGTPHDDPALTALLRQLATQQARVLVSATLDAHGRLPLPLLADGDVVVQLSGSETSIRSAYQLLRALRDQCAHGSVSLLVTATDPAHARRVHANLFQAASRYLALSVRSIVAQETSHV